MQTADIIPQIVILVKGAGRIGEWRMENEEWRDRGESTTDKGESSGKERVGFQSQGDSRYALLSLPFPPAHAIIIAPPPLPRATEPEGGTQKGDQPFYSPSTGLRPSFAQDK